MSLAKPAFSAFREEVLAIKVAEERESVTSAQVGHALKNLAIGAGAFGLGAGTSFLAQKYLLPKILANVSPQTRAIIAGATGLITAAGSLAFSKAMQENKELVRESAERHE